MATEPPLWLDTLVGSTLAEVRVAKFHLVLGFQKQDEFSSSKFVSIGVQSEIHIEHAILHTLQKWAPEQNPKFEASLLLDQLNELVSEASLDQQGNLQISFDTVLIKIIKSGSDSFDVYSDSEQGIGRFEFH